MWVATGGVKVVSCVPENWVVQMVAVQDVSAGVVGEGC